ncbi:MAG: cytoplasmic protein [Acidobacteria bacterium]|nr:cytoplasmic protein [Acidobacteriota bacterium]
MNRVLSLMVLLCLPVSTAIGQDPVKVAPKQCKVDFENDQVRVLRWNLGPHEKTPMHEHPATVTVFLTEGQARFTSPDGKTREADTKAGQVVWSAAEKHASENLSAKPAEVIQIELKTKPATAR